MEQLLFPDTVYLNYSFYLHGETQDLNNGKTTSYFGGKFFYNWYLLFVLMSVKYVKGKKKCLGLSIGPHVGSRGIFTIIHFLEN